MTLSLLHLNIWEGTFIERILEYIRQNNFDIIHLQEVNGGDISRGGLYPNILDQNDTPLSPQNVGIDNFAVLKKGLPEYLGILGTSWQMKDDPSTYMGNATFLKLDITVERHEVIRHNEYREIPTLENRDAEREPRSSLAVLTEINNQKMWFINTHLAWGPKPVDTQEKLQQAQVLFNFVSSLKEPFILTGDFNVTADTEIVKMFSGISRNLAVEHNITNTLNESMHKAKHIFPPGLAVDFILSHPSIHVTDFRVIPDDLSDHLGLQADFSV